MKTQISKENAIIILDNALRQQALVQKLEKIAGTVINEYNGSLGTIEALFNIEFDNLSSAEYDAYFNVFFDYVNAEGIDFTERARKLYEEVLEIKDYQANNSLLRIKIPKKDALIIIKNQILDYILWIELEGLSVKPSKPINNYSDTLNVIFDNVPLGMGKDELMEIFYLESDEFARLHDSKCPIPEEKLLEVSRRIYYSWKEEASRQLSALTNN